MKHNFLKRMTALVLALVCVLGILPLSAFADSKAAANAPSSITQKSAEGLRIDGKRARYATASDVVNSHGLSFVFSVQMNVPGLNSPTRTMCSYHKGFVGAGANGQRWDYKTEFTHPSLKALLTYVYSSAYGEFTAAGNAAGMSAFDSKWSDIWFVAAQGLTWYHEYGVLIDCTTDREGFVRQVAEEMVAVFKMHHDLMDDDMCPWIASWDAVDIDTILDSADNGVTGRSAREIASAAMALALDHPDYFPNYHLWEYEWDDSQKWTLEGSTPNMQTLLIVVPDADKDEDVQLTVKKLEAGTNKPIPGVTFKVESADGSGDFSVTRPTGADGTFTLASEADDLSAGQYKITELAAPEGYAVQTESQIVTVMPGDSADSTFTFYNVPAKSGEGSIRKVDADNPAVGIPGAVIKITSVKLDDGGSFTDTYTTKDGGYISKEDLDFAKLPTGSYVAEEITPPKG